jgi:hypothetical protein
MNGIIGYDGLEAAKKSKRLEGRGCVEGRKRNYWSCVR